MKPNETKRRKWIIEYKILQKLRKITNEEK